MDGQRQAFTWGGACSLYDAGTRTRKLPDGAPDPFRARAEAVEELLRRVGEERTGAKRVALAEAFQLKTLFPYFATLFRGLGLDLEVVRPVERDALRRGIEAANVPFCAPMQQYHGIVQEMAATGADFVFLPMLRELPPVKDEKHTWLCPIVQGAPDVVRHDLGKELGPRVLSPVIRTGEGFLEDDRFLAAIRGLAADVGVRDPEKVAAAHAAAREAQRGFDRHLVELGRDALERCRRDGLLPVVVLGRAYTLHDDVLNSNVPALLREQGALAIPVDCFPVADEAPLVQGAFWSYTQRILRAAHEIRRTPGLYSIFTSNYACGPDSFTLHHYGRLMEGKPFAIIETDGHAGDAGTKTRVEAFLHCVREDLRSGASISAAPAPLLSLRAQTLPELAAVGSRILIPPMGPEKDAIAAAFKGYGLDVELLPEATVETIRIGRRHTSGKECLPMTITIGALLERIEREPRRAFTFFMPGSNGPCRFGMYRQLHQMVLDRVGEGGRVGIFSPPDSDYFQGVPPGLGAIVLGALTGYGMLADALRDARPVELTPGAADAIHARWSRAAVRDGRARGRGDLSARKVMVEAATGRAYGIRDVVAGFARELRAVKDPRPHPTVLLVGEIYVRSDPVGERLGRGRAGAARHPGPHRAGGRVHAVLGSRAAAPRSPEGPQGGAQDPDPQAHRGRGAARGGGRDGLAPPPPGQGGRGGRLALPAPGPRARGGARARPRRPRLAHRRARRAPVRRPPRVHAEQARRGAALPPRPAGGARLAHALAQRGSHRPRGARRVRLRGEGRLPPPSRAARARDGAPTRPRTARCSAPGASCAARAPAGRSR